ncbi:MAG: tetratricopeptide repeat protein [Anaerolineae bacterium]|nr:tetratricopeptide repeat protein [Anaerolineae bacterium]
MAKHPDAFQTAMNQGHSAAWDQNWDRAAAHYRKALELSDDDPQALTSLGLALIELQDFEGALNCYQKAAKVSPNDPLPLEKIAQLCERMGSLDLAAQAALRGAELYLQNKDIQKAVENWERVTRLDPENLLARSRLAMVYEKSGENSKAVSQYLAFASILHAGGNTEKARQAIDQALKINPNSQEAADYLSLIRDFKPLPKPVRPRGGTAPLRMAQVRQLQAPSASAQLELDPVSQACQKALTQLAEMLFETEEETSEPAAPAPAGRKGLQALVSSMSVALSKPQDRPRKLLHLSQVIDLQARGEYGQAADELLRAQELGLDHSAVSFDLGYLFAQIGRFDSAIRHLQNAVKNADFALGSRILLGDMFRKKVQIREASFEYLQDLKLADLEIAPINRVEELSQLYELLIESHRKQKDARMQERLCEGVHEMLARADWREQIKRARQQLPGFVEGGPLIPLAEVMTESRSGQVIESVSRIYEMMEAGLYHSAMEEAYYALEQTPTYLPLHSLMGEMLFKQNDYESAVAKFRVIARAYGSRGETQQAIQYSRKVVELAPADLSARKKLIEQLIAFGQVENALDEYVNLADVYYSMADLASARNTFLEAFKAAQQANVDRYLKVRLLRRIVDIDMQSLDWRQGLRILDQIRTLQPEDEEARLQIVGLNFRMGQEQQALTELDHYIAYLTSNNKGQKLQHFMERLISEHAESIPMRRRYVDALVSAGKSSEAISQLDEIGEALLQSGDRAGAIQAVEKIITLGPPNKEEYLTLLAQLRQRF